MNVHLMKNYEECEEIPEPSTNSSDPEERKLARRIRIQRRLDRLKKFDTARLHHGSLTYFEYNNPFLVKQLRQTKELLSLLAHEGNEVITNVRVGSDAREVARRDNELVRRENLLEKLHNEAAEADEMFIAINKKWAKVYNYKDPLDLHDNLIIIKEKCDELIKQKDDIISMLKKEINADEMKFLADQEIQTDNITTLIKRINLQLSLMHDAQWNELDMTDFALGHERLVTIEKNNVKWEKSYNRLMKLDEEHVKDGIATIDDYLKEMSELRLDHGDRCRKLKITMENECEILQRELEKLKRICALDEVKLYFNYYNIRKRENEHFVVYTKYIFDSFDLQQAVLSIRNEIRDYRISSEEAMASLVIDTYNLRNLLLTMEKKGDHFILLGEQRFHKVWKLNVKRCTAILSKVLRMDEVLHEHVLGLRWKPPLKKIRLTIESLPSFKEAQKVLDLIYKPDIVDKLAEKAGQEVKIPDKLIKLIFEKICYGSGFLIEQKLKPVLPTLSEPHQNLVKMENVLEALGVHSDEELKVMIQFFVPYLRCPICELAKLEKYRWNKETFDFAAMSDVSDYDDRPITEVELKIEDATNVANKVYRAPTVVRRELDSDSDASGLANELKGMLTPESSLSGVLSESGTIVGCKCNHPVYLEFGYVFRALKDFFATIFPETTKRKLTIAERIEKKTKTLSRMISSEDITLFWNQYRKVVPRNTTQLYDALLFTLTKYHGILKARSKLNREIRLLKKENAELKHLLKNCPVEHYEKLITVTRICTKSNFTSPSSSSMESKQED
ncbi:uncharacterized protein CBL_13323 [Carabus blaptoides fortunei]